MGDSNPDSRWTCEACGCHTNQSSDRSCSICGTSPSSGPSILRRSGSYAARVGWIARGLRRPEDLEEDELWETVVDHMASASSNPPAAQHEQHRPPNPTAILAAATAATYRPIWIPHREGQVQDGVAHLEAEGRAVRATSALPTANGPVGFRVAFDHPAADTGGNMGGCHLIGVTTASFTAFHEPNALQQSAFFWGIEDGGQKYEGRRRSRHELVDAPFTSSNVLFGCRQTMTVVCDWESRSLTFWRDGVLLGTLVSHLPRVQNLYPVAVPFNCGVTVAITSLQDDPLPLLRSFALSCRREQQDKETEIRRKIKAKRDRLIQGKSMTTQLAQVLRHIFESYKPQERNNYARLWYRCGIKLSLLPKAPVTWKDFQSVVEQVIAADVFVVTGGGDDNNNNTSTACQVGDKVQLATGYEKYGDSSGGPLQPGDRGSVLELQKGPNGERRSVRVFHNGRRWWYQPQAVVSERTGLIDSPAVWFLDALLRSHGYDSETLEPMNNQTVTAASWRIGDVVAPKKDSPHGYGRIVPETSSRTLHNSRYSGSVNIEFVDRLFAEDLGIKVPAASNSEDPMGLQTRRVRVIKLVHSTALGSLDNNESNNSKSDEVMEEVKAKEEEVEPERKLAPVGDKLQAEIAAVARLEQSAMDAVAKECKKSSDALASLFSAGLPEAVLSAIDVAAKQMNSLEPREDLFEKIAAIGVLVAAIAEKLYAEKSSSTTEMPSEQPPDAPAEDSEDSDSAISEQADEIPDAAAAAVDPSSLLPPGLLVAGRRPRGDDFASNLPQLMNASLQQRRGMLLSLLSRGSRRRALNELTERRSALEAGLAQGPFGMQPPFVFGAPLANEGSSNALWEGNVPGADISPNPPPASSDESVLDTLLRCRGDSAEALSGSLRQGGAAFFAFIRHLISSGILVNSREWVDALIRSYQNKKSPSAHRSPSSILRNAVDEDGTPVLQLAILLGCNTEIIRLLISCGTPVGTEELQKAAETNQPRTLSLLLQHSSYCEGVVSMDDCSTEVRHVLNQAKERQNQLDRQMRDTAGAFIASVAKKLIALGLASRRNQSSRTVICSKVVCGILVGDVLLRALQRAQKSTEMSEDSSSADRSGRVPVEDSFASLSPEGVLRYLPAEVVGEIIFGDKESVTSFLLLLEDYLCSKDMFDAAAGLTLFSIVLKHFPQIRSSPLLERFGLAELVSFHDVLASNRIAEILSKEFTTGLDVSSAKSEGPDSSSGARHDGSGVVRCPKKHTAVLHITRHSSFRCDVCGCGVDRGKPMHGCRECDWDACEECTDKSESGLIKCTAIRELACDCLRLVSQEEESEEKALPYAAVLEELSQDNSTMALNAIAVRLLQHDVEAIKELGLLLQDPGRVSFHQFFSSVLPTIHASLSGRLPDGEGALLSRSRQHKNKKARVAGCCADSSSLSPDSRFEYCRASVRCLLEGVSRSSEEEEQNDSSTKAKEDKGSERSTLSTLGSNSSGPSLKGEIAYSTLASELLRRIHQVLSFYEGVNMFSSSVRRLDISGGEKGGELHTLMKPVEVHLTQYSLTDVTLNSRNCRLNLDVEPLVPVSDLELHILRSCRIDEPVYSSYCHALASEAVVIIERPASDTAGNWKVGKVVGYNEKTGAHCVQYANRLPQLEKDRECVDVNEILFEDEKSIVFDGSISNLVLAAREYVVVHRSDDASPKKVASPCATTRPRSKSDLVVSSSCALTRAVGTRVESKCGGGDSWQAFTLIGVDTGSTKKAARAVLVSDEGVLFSDVPLAQIRFTASDRSDESSGESDALRLAHQVSEDRNSLRRSFPFTFGTRQRSDHEGAQLGRPGTLKRTWSAIALAASMQPVDITTTTNGKKPAQSEIPRSPSWLCQIGQVKVKLTCNNTALELPPKLSVKFSTSDKLPAVSLSAAGETTLACALTTLHHHQEKWREWPPVSACKLFFTLSADAPHIVSSPSFTGGVTAMDCDASESLSVTTPEKASTWTGRSLQRSRKHSARSPSPVSQEKASSLCDGLDEICVQCMDVIGILSQHAEDSSEATESDSPTIPGFANMSLSKKLTDQLDDPLCVVGGALPEWCTSAPAFAPRAFSYRSRQLLLQRAAFGVSRSTLKQQESKVNVGRLRQRMASLRARAVELMGEAFSGGAEDPTALQLQADELYGMEETLAARVRAAFRAAKWQEHSLQVAKAAVRRDSILDDAAAIMERYAKDETVNRRRLEVRFDGETGFDAASGDEAGVTRGFYADVAEALLSSDLVAGVLCSSSCSRIPSTEAAKKTETMDIESTEEPCKLPVWIPDMDTSAQVVIPTPRADSRSSLGVYPRPLPRYHPQLPEVLYQFQLMGRLFAAAMRDGFMFPLPLSAAFLKLVQHGTDSVASSSDTNSKPASQHDLLLTAADLPRPGFLGGEVYAADTHICKALNALDASDPTLLMPELRRRYREIASDKNFARVAFGMSYDCSFEDYFQDRTFVDPLDPTQGDEAVPLCTKGHKKSVTIYNVREWVAQAKSFILHDGVIAQAMAFRQGVEDFFPAKFLRLFTPEELQRDVCGTGDNVDNWDEGAVRKLFKLNGGKGAAEALVAVAAIGGEGGAAMSRRFGPSSPTIAFLVKALLEATPRQRRQFLSFVTSVPIVTPGRIEVVPLVSPSGEFLPMQDPACLPRANTCARRLYLPKFDTFDSFSDVLWAVVREESRFKGFYEWRGAS